MKLAALTFLLFSVSVWPCFPHQNVNEKHPHGAAGKIVKIGLLIPDNNSSEARHGAELAIRIANEHSEKNRVTFELAVRSMEGPWGTGSKQAVDLIYEDGVVAILGSHDGRNAHLVEQVAAKEKIIFVSAWASDPTLSQAFVPWFFNCVPNDNQQASALIEEIFRKEEPGRLIAVSQKDYDSKLSLKSFISRMDSSGRKLLQYCYYNADAGDFSSLIDSIVRTGVKGIILFGHPPQSLRLISQIRKMRVNLPVFGGLSLLGENEPPATELKRFIKLIVISPGYYFTTRGIAFREEFLKQFGFNPGPAAAYAFDGMNLIIEAIRKSGTGRAEIQKYLENVNNNGVTGSIKFDLHGNRTESLSLMEIKNGSLAEAKR